LPISSSRDGCELGVYLSARCVDLLSKWHPVPNARSVKPRRPPAIVRRFGREYCIFVFAKVESACSGLGWSMYVEECSEVAERWKIMRDGYDTDETSRI
jgi:hypothetical protein